METESHVATDREQELTATLHYALDVIRNYEIDVRRSFPGGALFSIRGLWEGRFYRGARQRIAKMAGITLPLD